MRILWTARRSSQSILKEISPEYSLEGLMLKLQYFSHLMQRPYSLEKTLTLGRIDAEAETPILWPCDEKSKLIGKVLMLGKIEGRRRRGNKG